MATPPNQNHPNPFPPGFMGQGFVQSNSIISANSSHPMQMQMMQMQTQMFQMHPQMTPQAHPNAPFSFPNNGTCGANGGNSQPHPNSANTNQTVVLGIPVPNAGFGQVQLPYFQTHMQPNSLQSPSPGQVANIPMLSSPHFHPNSMQMSNNNNMHVVGQQYQQQFVAAATSMQTFSSGQCFHNSFPPAASLQANNHQPLLPPQGSNTSLSVHTNSSSSSIMPPVPPYRPPMPMNNAPPTHFNSPPLPPGQRPPLLATTPFPSLEQGAQTLTCRPPMGQNLASNSSFQVGGSIPLQTNQLQLQQGQQNMQPSKHQTLEGSSNEQDSTINEPHIKNDIHQYQTGVCYRGHSSRIGGGRWNSQNGRTGSGKFCPKRNFESSRFNTSEQAGGRARKASPLAKFPPTRVFDNGSSRFSKDSAGCTRSYASALICKSCDRSFTNRFQMEQHLKCHVKCEEKGCSFEASGEILKEHKLSHHEKKSIQSVVLPKSEESAEEIQQWIDERRRNYPTEANVKRKVQQVQGRRARGELVDDDTKIRRQRMREILAKQRELGLPEAEVPSHYINDDQYYHKGHFKNGSWQHDDNLVKPNLSANSARKVPRVRDLASPRSVLNYANSLNMEQPTERKAAISASESPCFEGNLLSETPEKVDEDCKTEGSASQVAIKTKNITAQHAEDSNSQKSQKICRYFQRGHCRKGRRCTYLHIRQSNKTPKRTTESSDPVKRKPTLLEKLLAGDIKKEKSHLLQIFRFMVNNSFFTEWPNKPLNFLQGSGEALNIDSQRAEIQYLSYLNTLHGIGEGDTELDDWEADLDEVDGIKNVSMGRMECSRGDDFEADLDENKVAERERRRDDLEEGEIEEGEIV